MSITETVRAARGSNRGGLETSDTPNRSGELWQVALAGSSPVPSTTTANLAHPSRRPTISSANHDAVARAARESGIRSAMAVNAYKAENVRIVGMSKWTGRIVSVDLEQRLFTAEIRSETAGTANEVLLADFTVDVLGDDEPLEAGDLIYVTSRVVRRKGNLRTTTTSVRRRRLGRWTSEQVETQQTAATARLKQAEEHFG